MRAPGLVAADVRRRGGGESVFRRYPLRLTPSVVVHRVCGRRREEAGRGGTLSPQVSVAPERGLCVRFDRVTDVPRLRLETAPTHESADQPSQRLSSEGFP